MALQSFLEWRHWRATLMRNASLTLWKSVIDTLPVNEHAAFSVNSGNGRLIPMSLPFLPHPLWVRAGTSDINVFDQVFLTGQYDFEDLASLNPTTIVDAGAHIGTSTIFFAHLFPNANIIAIEPEESNLTLLRRNIEPYPRVNVLRAGLWDRNCFLRIANPTADTWAFQTVKADPGLDRVPGISIEGVLNLLGNTRLNLLKLDIEGAEKQLFADPAATWLDSLDVLIIELHDRFTPGCAQALYKSIGNRPFLQHCKGDSLMVSFT